MAFRVELVAQAARDLDALPDRNYRQLRTRIDALAENPYPPGVKRVQGGESLYRIRSGDYRILYRVERRQLLVLVVRIGHRREVYRGL